MVFELWMWEMLFLDCGYGKCCFWIVDVGNVVVGLGICVSIGRKTLFFFDLFIIYC